MERRAVPELAQIPRLKAPSHSFQRGPLARVIERNLQQRDELFSDPLIDLRTARLIFGVCESTIRRWIKLKILPVVRFSPRGRLKIRTSVLQALLAKGTNE
jgi:Helix-turn-helix domain